MNTTDELVIEAGRTERNYWRDLFRYRELFYFVAWSDVLVRYKQTVIGIAIGGAAYINSKFETGNRLSRSRVFG